ncbi:MAG: protein translocase subunit SecF, partial [Candidatus Cloacimonetes bacterium]|nr:protein translocase subunit SecF [Candidatus Cloacimonadota bacterium]
MRFFENTKIDFISKRRIAYVISVILIIIGIAALIVGPKLSIDFTGGTSLELDMTAPSEEFPALYIGQIRETLVNEGMTDVEIQTIRGFDEQTFFLFKTQAGGTEASRIIQVMRTNFPEYTQKQGFIRLQEEVGPRIGEELKGKAIMAILISLLGIIIYIWWRFEFTFGVAAVAALFHDVLITVGIFFITGREISLAIVAALLTIVGYSLNDTIVVFDRIREDLKIYRKETYGSVINHSINETLSRTIITSMTTFVVVLSLYILGGSVIRDFAFALMIGVIVGTYSSIFVASPLLVEFFGQRHPAKKGIAK